MANKLNIETFLKDLHLVSNEIPIQPDISEIATARVVTGIEKLPNGGLVSENEMAIIQDLNSAEEYIVAMRSTNTDVTEPGNAATNIQAAVNNILAGSKQKAQIRKQISAIEARKELISKIRRRVSIGSAAQEIAEKDYHYCDAIIDMAEAAINNQTEKYQRAGIRAFTLSKDMLELMGIDPDDSERPQNSTSAGIENEREVTEPSAENSSISNGLWNQFTAWLDAPSELNKYRNRGKWRFYYLILYFFISSRVWPVCLIWLWLDKWHSRKAKAVITIATFFIVGMTYQPSRQANSSNSAPSQSPPQNTISTTAIHQQPTPYQILSQAYTLWLNGDTDAAVILYNTHLDHATPENVSREHLTDVYRVLLQNYLSSGDSALAEKVARMSVIFDISIPDQSPEVRRLIQKARSAIAEEQRKQQIVEAEEKRRQQKVYAEAKRQQEKADAEAKRLQRKAEVEERRRQQEVERAAKLAEAEAAAYSRPARDESDGRCLATTRRGYRCSRSAGTDGYCWQHQ